MSQEKVERYKEEKMNRKEMQKRRSRRKLISNIAVTVVIIGIIGAVGYGVYDNAMKNTDGTSADTVNVDALGDYMGTLNTQTAMAVMDDNVATDAAVVVSNDAATVQ